MQNIIFLFSLRLISFFYLSSKFAKGQTWHNQYFAGIETHLCHSSVLQLGCLSFAVHSLQLWRNCALPKRGDWKTQSGAAHQGRSSSCHKNFCEMLRGRIMGSTNPSGVAGCDNTELVNFFKKCRWTLEDNEKNFFFRKSKEKSMRTGNWFNKSFTGAQWQCLKT